MNIVLKNRMDADRGNAARAKDSQRVHNALDFGNHLRVQHKPTYSRQVSGSANYSRKNNFRVGQAARSIGSTANSPQRKESKIAKAINYDFMDDQTITAGGQGNLNPQTPFIVKFTIDRVTGRLTWMLELLGNCVSDQPGAPRGMCFQSFLYDCSSAPPKPKF
jgi:hypothetical protein